MSWTSVSALELAAGDEVGRQLQLLVAGDLARGLDALLLAERAADVVPGRLEEREAHRAADQDRVGALQERLEHADLVGHLRAADDGHQRPLRVLEDAVQRRHLALEQPARGGRQQVRDRLGGRVRAVRGAERVVDVDVGDLRVALGERLVVLRLALEEAHVLEHHDLAVGDVVEVRRELRRRRRSGRTAGRRRARARTSAHAPSAGRDARAGRARTPPSRAARSASAAPPGCARRR